MRTIWCFGDSFTEGFSETNPYSIHKGYQPKTHPQIIGERLGIDWVNLGKGGWSNSDILESIGNTSHKIQSDDIVSIGWSHIPRFRLADSYYNKWQSIIPNYQSINSNPPNFLNNEVSDNTLDEILYNRDSPLYKNELQSWVKLMEHTFRDNILVNWTWAHLDWRYTSNYHLFKFQTIYKETDGVVDDRHWSEGGHHQFSDWFISTIHKSKHTSVLSDIVYI
jgi:hypothetical protein